MYHGAIGVPSSSCRLRRGKSRIRQGSVVAYSSPALREKGEQETGTADGERRRRRINIQQPLRLRSGQAARNAQFSSINDRDGGPRCTSGQPGSFVLLTFKMSNLFCTCREAMGLPFAVEPVARPSVEKCLQPPVSGLRSPACRHRHHGPRIARDLKRLASASPLNLNVRRSSVRFRFNRQQMSAARHIHIALRITSGFATVV